MRQAEAGSLATTAVDTTAATNTPQVTEAGLGSSAVEVPAEPVLSAAVDFSRPEVIEMACCNVEIKGDKTLTITNCEGKSLANFKLDGSGKLVPMGAQPSGNQVKSSYSGAPGDTYSAYKVYPADYKAGNGVKPYLALDYNKGTLNVTPGSEVKRSRQASKGKTRKSGGSSGDPGCNSGGGGG